MVVDWSRVEGFDDLLNGMKLETADSTLGGWQDSPKTQYRNEGHRGRKPLEVRVGGEAFRFRLDSKKGALNLRKHRISFEEAHTVFSDPAILNVPDSAHSESEERWYSIGHASSGSIVVFGVNSRQGL